MSAAYLTGLPGLDAAFRGLRTGELTVVAGPSSQANSTVLAALERGLGCPDSTFDASSALDPNMLREQLRELPSGHPRAVFVDSLRSIHGIGPGVDRWGLNLAQLASELEIALVGTWLTPDRPSNRAWCSDVYNTVAEDPGLLLLVEGPPGAREDLEVICTRLHDRGMPSTSLRVATAV